MIEIADLSERQPHLTICTPGAVHVVPVTLVRDVIAGRQPAEVLSELVLQRIIEEWLEAVSG